MNKVEFEDFYNLITDQLTTALRGFEQFANLVRAGQINLSDIKTSDLPGKEILKGSQSGVPVTHPVTTKEVADEVHDPIPVAVPYEEDVDDIPQPVSTAVTAKVNPEESEEDPEPEAVYPTDWGPGEYAAYNVLRSNDFDHGKAIEAVEKIRDGSLVKSAKEAIAQRDAQILAIDTKPYLAHFNGLESLIKRFVHGTYVPGGRGELSVGTGDVTLPLFRADPSATKAARLTKWQEGFYVNPKNEQLVSLLLRTEKFTIVFPNIQKVDNDLPYIVEAEGTYSETRQPISVFSFPDLSKIYFATRDRLIALNGLKPEQFTSETF